MNELRIRSKSLNRVSLKRRIRKNIILNALRSNGALSLTELSRRTGFNVPTITNLVKELENEDYVIREKGAAGTPGRPPQRIRINTSARYVIGADLGRFNTNIILADLSQKIIYRKLFHTLDLHNPAVIDQLVKEIQRAIAESHVEKNRVLGVGLAIPGLVNCKSGRSITFLNFEDRPVREIFEEKLDLPVFVENDARAMALGELWFGLAREAKNALCLNLGWGIGLGIITNGRIYHGNDGFAGEFGHITIKENGPLCQCGKYGCLESLASGHAIAEQAREMVSTGRKTKLSDLIEGKIDQLNAELVVKAAQMGDQLSIEIIEQAGRYIGQGLAILINLFNPEIVILGGRVSRAGRFLLNPIQTEATKRALPHISERAEIVVSKLGYLSGALGATTLVKKEIFQTSHIDVSAFV